MKPDLIDCRILKLVYDRPDWENKLWLKEDFRLKIKATDSTLYYHLRKLCNAEMLKEVRTNPKIYQATDKAAFEKAEKMIAFALKYLVRTDDRI